MNISPTGLDWGYIGTIVATFSYAIYQQFRAGKKDTAEAEKTSLSAVVTAKDALIETITQERDSWRNRFDAKSEDYKRYQNEVHSKAETMQAQILLSSQEAAELRAKTDLTPILEHMKEDKAATKQIVEQMSTTARILETILTHLGLNKSV